MSKPLLARWLLWNQNRVPTECLRGFHNRSFRNMLVSSHDRSRSPIIFYAHFFFFLSFLPSTYAHLEVGNANIRDVGSTLGNSADAIGGN